MPANREYFTGLLYACLFAVLLSLYKVIMDDSVTKTDEINEPATIIIKILIESLTSPDS